MQSQSFQMAETNRNGHLQSHSRPRPGKGGPAAGRRPRHCTAGCWGTCPVQQEDICHSSSPVPSCTLSLNHTHFLQIFLCRHSNIGQCWTYFLYSMSSKIWEGLVPNEFYFTLTTGPRPEQRVCPVITHSEPFRYLVMSAWRNSMILIRMLWSGHFCSANMHWTS